MKEREEVMTNEELDEKIIGNPIHAYKTVKRFAVDLKKIEQDMNEQEDDWKGTTRTIIKCGQLLRNVANFFIKYKNNNINFRN